MSVADFSSLDTRLPLALLPVRLEARYLPRHNPTHLHVRMFPDVLHADAHLPALSAREVGAGRQFWTSIWGAPDAVVVSEGRRWLAAQTGPYRALWVATATRPTNLDEPGASGPAFPELVAEESSEPVRAALLPDQWMLRLYDAGLALAHTVFGTAISDRLPMAPRLSATGVDAVHPRTGGALSAPLAFLAGQDLLWTVDFEQAEAVGMAIRIPLANVPAPVGVLLALGIRAGRVAEEEGRAFDALLTSHWYSRGLDVVPQGTPTNNTDAGRSGVSLSTPDIDALFEREASSRPLAPIGRALLIAADPALLYRIPAADSISLAFGRIRATALDKTPHAEWGEGAAAWAMNVAIGSATLGAYLAGPLAKVDGRLVTGDATPKLRDWFADWTRGGAALPVLRCGEQPYGLLPITHRPVERPNASEFAFQYEHQVAKLLPIWRAALPAAALDPDATDSLPSGSELGDASIIAEVLGAVPHAVKLQLRAAKDHWLDDAERFQSAISELEAIVGDYSLLSWDDHKPGIAGLPGGQPPDVATQIENLREFRRVVAVFAPSAIDDALAPALRVIDDDLMPLLVVHDRASRAVPEVLEAWNEGGGVAAENVIRLVSMTFARKATAVRDRVTRDGDLAEIRSVITLGLELLDRAEADNLPPSARESFVESPAPLLAHLIDINCRRLRVPEIGPVRVALRVLLALIDAPRVENPEAELERLMLESLGLGLYRLDAWIAAIAAKRLAEKRRARPAGLQLGGYGWLLDLSRSEDRASQGFIHAPSLPHAASAAVLRSGWSAYGAASGTAPLAVDLSSDRVRGAHWVLDGVRNGQDLSELLGARFERFLHDAHLDTWIDTVRRAVLRVRGSERPPLAIVDGLLVARSGSDLAHTLAEKELRDELNTATAVTGTDADEDARRAAVRRAWRRLAADLDSVADLTLAQSVHSLLQGNEEAASAAMAVMSGGDAAVPRVDVAATQRDALLVSHRVVALWQVSEASPESSSPLASLSPLYAAEPRLVAWLGQLLPPVEQVVADFTVIESTGAVRVGTFSLVRLGLTNVETAVLAAAAPQQARSRLGRAVRAAVAASVGGSVTVDLAAPRSTRDELVSVDEFGVIATGLLDAMGRTRPLRAADLVLASVDASAHGFDAGELSARARHVEDVLRGLITALGGDAAARSSALVRCATIGVRGALRALEAGADDVAIAPIAEALARRLVPPADPPPDPVAAALGRLQRLAGGALPVLPVFTPVADAERVASAGSSLRRQQIAFGGNHWLRQAARVRPDLGASIDFLLMLETLTGRISGPYGLAQLPDTSGPWAAVDRPGDDRDRLSIVSLTGPDALGIDTGPIAGVLIDSWTEGIPRKAYQTALAVHFDAPTARPPQAVLLSVVDEERGFSADELADQLLFTIELAKVRALQPSAPEGLGQYLPSVFLPDDVVISGADS